MPCFTARPGSGRLLFDLGELMNADEVQVWLSLDDPTCAEVLALRDRAADGPDPKSDIVDLCNDHLLKAGCCVLCAKPAAPGRRGACEEHAGQVIL
jgi:hypothetical protein